MTHVSFRKFYYNDDKICGRSFYLSSEATNLCWVQTMEALQESNNYLLLSKPLLMILQNITV